MSKGLKYSEWNERGYRIHKGQKAHSFRDGEAVFLLSQVYDPTDPPMSAAEEAYLIRAQEWETPPH
jgi:hypothetical protein